MRTWKMASSDLVAALPVAVPGVERQATVAALRQAPERRPGGAPPWFTDPFAPINPRTIAGGASCPGWSLPGNGGATAEHAEAMLAGCKAAGIGRGMAMGLAGVLEASLHAVALRFA